VETARTQNGLVGFFDILGYQSFLENNDAEDAASEVLTVITNIGSITGNALISSLKHPDERLKELIDGIQWLVFSDTILMAMAWDEQSVFPWTAFSLAAIQLCRHMFDFGLPLRGAIKTGKYLISQSCFAGRVIVEAYRTETSLNLAACSIDETLVEMMKKKVKDPNWIESLVVGYMTPLANGQHKKMYLLNYLLPDGVSPKKPNAVDIPQLVLNSFWAHGGLSKVSITQISGSVREAIGLGLR